VLLRGAFVTSAAALVLGLVLRLAGIDGLAWVLPLGLVLLASNPILRLVAVLVDLVRRREWPFVWSTLSVFALLIVTWLWPSN
jgi:uncharacterized membrane protein